MRAHIIQNGVVANTIEVESLDALPGLTLIDADAVGGTIGDLWDGQAISKPAPDLAAIGAASALQIDSDADAIREAILGKRTTEYQQAESDANAFKSAGYAGTVPEYVQDWLDAKNAVGANWTAQQSADDILTTASQWKSAQSQIRSNRLLRKEQVKVATTQADIDAAMSAWRTFCAQIRAQLGLPA